MVQDSLAWLASPLFTSTPLLFQSPPSPNHLISCCRTPSVPCFLLSPSLCTGCFLGLEFPSPPFLLRSHLGISFSWKPSYPARLRAHHPFKPQHTVVWFSVEPLACSDWGLRKGRMEVCSSLYLQNPGGTWPADGAHRFLQDECLNSPTGGQATTGCVCKWEPLEEFRSFGLRGGE